MHGRRRLLLAAGLVLLGALSTALPWWRSATRPVRLGAGPPQPVAADSWAGWEVLGLPVTGLLVALAVAASVAALRRPAGGRVRPLVAASGAAATSAALVGLATWGVTTAPGPGLAGAAGIGALALVVRPPGRAVLTCALVAAVVAAVLPGVARPPDRRVDGPFVRIATADADRPLRSGEPDLPVSLTVEGSGLGEIGGSPVAYTPAGLVGAEADGRARVVALTDGDGTVLGVADGRVARLVGGDTVLVTGLAPGDPTRVRITDVQEASPVGADGSVWLRTSADTSGVVRRLDLDAYAGEQDLLAVYLPVVTVRPPPGTGAIDLADVRIGPDGAALRFTAGSGGYRLERLALVSTGLAVDVVAGATDPACGLNAGARTTALPSRGPTAVDGDGTWLVVGDRLARIGPDGRVRAVPAPTPGTVTALVVLPDGALVLATTGRAGPALWRLPDPRAALADLPPVPDDCVPEPPAVGPPVTFVPIGNTGRDALGVPLGVDGSWASGTPGDGDVLVVPPGGADPVPLGRRRDGRPEQVRPDGSGGAWWLEGTGDLVVLVHGRRGGPEERFTPVRHPAPRDGSTLIPDLGGRPPLLGTVAGAFRIDGGRAVRVVDGAVGGGAVRADGRGWVLAGGRLLALDGDRVLGPVVEPAAGGDPGIPVVVQLAKGVPPQHLALPPSSVGFDAGGQAVVVSDGVVLRIDDAGLVSVVAQDDRLRGPFTVEGGLVAHDGGVLSRIDLPPTGRAG